MAVAIGFVVAVLAALPRLAHDPQAELAMAQQMQQRREFLHGQMTELWQEVEQMRALEGALVHSVFKNWLFWATAAATLLELCWLAWQRKLAFISRDNNQGEHDSRRAPMGARLLAGYTPVPVQELPGPCRRLKQRVRGLLDISRELSRRTLMPAIYPDRGTDGNHECWSSLENRIFYQLLVLLRPPPGHSFILERDTVRQHPERSSGIRSMEHDLGHSLCFVHRQDSDMLQEHRSPVLETLCTGSFLNGEHICSWVPPLLLSAWLRLSPWPQRCLAMLPCSCSCKLLLSSPCEQHSCTEMFFAVHESSTDSFVVLE